MGLFRVKNKHLLTVFYKKTQNRFFLLSEIIHILGQSGLPKLFLKEIIFRLIFFFKVRWLNETFLFSYTGPETAVKETGI